ncbi:hypothetical protein [Merdibacter massiliensis]|uniref:hypothetical protein n=1 Tax=Merdibacter massiliensis TaxID=1871030 RepID=UPI00096ACAA1|nr:hypothetical protein [Merdibacter massiliensis]
MKKSNFISLILGTISLILFAVRMCMALMQEWDTLQPGIILGCVGLFFGFLTIFIWRKMEHEDPIHFSVKILFITLVTILGLIGLGTGMCFSMLWNNMFLGVFIGCIGIVILLSIIPLTKGIHD